MGKSATKSATFREYSPSAWALKSRKLLNYGGEGGIRTHEGLLTLAGFQDQCIQPLCHLSRFLLQMVLPRRARIPEIDPMLQP